MGHPGGSRVHGIAPLTHIYCSPCCQCPGMTKKYNVQSPWPAIHSLDCCSCRCFLWFLLDGQCDTHGQWDARKLRWQPGAAGKLCLITEGKQSVFTHKYANGIKNNYNNKPVWFRCVFQRILPRYCGDLASHVAAADIGLCRSARFVRTPVSAYVVWRKAQNALSCGIIWQDPKNAFRFPWWSCFQQTSLRMCFPLLPVYMRWAVLWQPEWRLETLPRAQSSIRWTLSILHIPASLRDKGQAFAYKCSAGLSLSPSLWYVLRLAS